MSMISHKISWWGISVVQVIQVIQVIQLICVMQVRLAHLWPNFRVIFVFLRLFIFFDITMELSKCKKVDFWVCGSMLQHKKDIVFVFVFVFTLLGSLWLSFRARQPKPNLLPGNFLIHNMTSFSFENSWVMGSLKYPQKGPWGAKNMKNLPIHGQIPGNTWE